MSGLTPLLENRGILEIKLWQLLSLRLYMNEEQLATFSALVEKVGNVAEDAIAALIETEIDPLIASVKEAKRGFLRNCF